MSNHTPIPAYSPAHSLASEPADVQRELAAFSNVLARVRGEVIAGTDVDLSGLPERTAALCTRIEALPRELGRSLAPILATLVRDATALGERISARHAVGTKA